MWFCVVNFYLITTETECVYQSLTAEEEKKGIKRALLWYLTGLRNQNRDACY